MAIFKKNKMYNVSSSNIDSVGLFEEDNVLVTKIKFVRGDVYAYWPCTEDEFEKVFDDITAVKDWFNTLKLNKNYKKL